MIGAVFVVVAAAALVVVFADFKDVTAVEGCDADELESKKFEVIFLSFFVNFFLRSFFDRPTFVF